MNSDPRQARIESTEILFHTTTAFIHSFLTVFLQFGRVISILVADILQQHRVSETLEAVATNLYDHPLLAIGIFGCALVCTLPVLTFIVVAASSAIFTFIVLIFIEGIILLASLLFFIPCFLTVLFLMAGCAAGLSAVYFMTFALGRAFNNSRKYAMRVRRIEHEE